jgi:hypothetical protein
MATRASTLTGAGPVVRPLLISLWLAAVAIVLATVVAAALMAGRVSTSSTVPGNGPAVSKTDTGPGAPAHKPFRVNGNICAQCR